MSAMEELAVKLNECAENKNFEGAFKLVRDNQVELSKNLSVDGIKDVLKKTTSDRLLLSFFGQRRFWREAFG